MISSFQKKIGYSFKNESLLKQAFTHSSYANEHGTDSDYERLEFLGDAVLELVVSELLYKKFPELPEGDLTKRRASLVCEQNLNKIAKSLALGANLRLGNGEQATGGRERSSILADVVEAVIGAVYIDGGLREAAGLINRLMAESLKDDEEVIFKTDYKSHLQEFLQRDSSLPVIYEVICETGPAHAKVFETQVLHNGAVLGAGVGRSKKESEQRAAYFALKRINEKKNPS